MKVRFKTRISRISIDKIEKNLNTIKEYIFEMKKRNIDDFGEIKQQRFATCCPKCSCVILIDIPYTEIKCKTCNFFSEIT